MVSESILKEFQKIIKEDYGIDITLGQAAEIMNDAVAYFDLLAKIRHRELVDIKNLVTNQSQP